jgi:hypothetical protein
MRREGLKDTGARVQQELEQHYSFAAGTDSGGTGQA